MSSQLTHRLSKFILNNPAWLYLFGFIASALVTLVPLVVWLLVGFEEGAMSALLILVFSNVVEVNYDI